MSKKTSVEGEGADNWTVKMKVVVPELPSAAVTSLIVRFGAAPATQALVGEAVLRATGALTGLMKSAALSLVSWQPPERLTTARASGSRPPAVLVEKGAGPEPS